MEGESIGDTETAARARRQAQDGRLAAHAAEELQHQIAVETAAREDFSVTITHARPDAVSRYRLGAHELGAAESKRSIWGRSQAREL